MKKEESKYLGPTGIVIKNYLTAKPVGLHVSKEKAGLWDDLKDVFIENKIRINPDGAEHMLKTYKQMAEVFFSTARSLGLDPKEYMDGQLHQILSVIKETENKKGVEDTIRFRDKLIHDMGQNVVGKLKTVFTR